MPAFPLGNAEGQVKAEECTSVSCQLAGETVWRVIKLMRLYPNMDSRLDAARACASLLARMHSLRHRPLSLAFPELLKQTA